MARRDYSAGELSAKLAEKGYSAETVAEVLESLRLHGWQSDARYAATLAQSRARRGFGPLYVRQRLSLAGVSDAAMTDIDWQQALAAAYQKKYGDTVPASHEEYARRGRFLQGRGFAAEQIRNFLDRLRQRPAND